jgi:glyoxylase-like metal-dependent hydrolase (beta-lactamase superfamily II)
MRFGDFDLQLVSDGEFRLDGGAMFGVVPRPMWERAKPPDAQNRIRLGTNCMLLSRGKDLVLVDTGIGDKHDDRFHALFGVDSKAPRLLDSLQAAGYEPGDVTHVILTHLHFDHCGWNTRKSGDHLVPTFPKARYWIEGGEMAHAQAPNERDRASYEGQNFDPLLKAGVVELFDDHAAPLTGIEVVKVPGHNADMCIVLVEGGAERIVFWADLVPTTAHVSYPWIMGYDLYPMQTLANKKLWLPRAVAGNWLGIFEHEAEVPVARLVEERPGRLAAVPSDLTSSLTHDVAPPQRVV